MICLCHMSMSICLQYVDIIRLFGCVFLLLFMPTKSQQSWNWVELQNSSTTFQTMIKTKIWMDSKQALENIPVQVPI